MIILIEVMLAILFFICTGLFFLHRYHSEEISELRDEIGQLKDEVTRQRSKVWLFEKKLIELSTDKDRIEIYHKYDDSDAPKYGGF